jgi:hypothetical protein
MKNNNGSLFEDDYLIRSLGDIVSQPEMALTELFGLRQKLASMYDDVQGIELYRQIQIPFK